ncbi:heterogeneous nuclear ribonucleoprotein R [Mytilus galloprovincialis]|uniref:Heterogeneous nuclear ribonucleoprotein R n=1 Tax=Mytilus galloprovincialis TaxID=29158 RepID=A0A8B6EPK5_MYTGA|nr:heterogeneous nuclear ribonucleoprotein R [Mytilus galloprovincialis]
MMAQVNGLDHTEPIMAETDKSEEYTKLVEYGINARVAEELCTVYKTEKLTHAELDERALDALKEFNADDAIAVLKQFLESPLEHVTNKSAYLCGMMKTYRQNKKQGSTATVARGPDEAKLKEILDRTGYSLDVTTGQRKYGGPPPGQDESNQPGAGHEVFCGKIPKDVFEDELIPLFEKCGPIWDLRLMMDPMTGFNRGYSFITYCDRDGANEAVKQLDNYEIKSGKRLKVNISVANQRLFVGNIPKSKSKEEILEEFSKKTEGLIDVIIYRSADKENQKNRGFAFLEYDSHKSASTAKRKLSSGRSKVWNCDVIVDWADPVEEPDNSTMSKVKVLYIRNLSADVSEELLKEKFTEYGKIERVKKIKDYGFVHYEERDDAVKALDAMNGQKLGKLEIEVSLAKPPTENKKKEQRKREQERRQMMGGYEDFYQPPMPPSRMMPPGRGMRRPMPPPPRFDYYDDFFGYEDYNDYYGGGYAPQMPRGRGGRGGPPPMRGRGGAIPPGGPRGAGAAVRGSRGAVRGRGAPASGRGGRGGITPQKMGQQMARGGKRKAQGDFSMGHTKRRNVQDNWGAQPIAQQPLDSTGYDASYNDSQWYQDSYGQNWG